MLETKELRKMQGERKDIRWKMEVRALPGPRRDSLIGNRQQLPWSSSEGVDSSFPTASQPCSLPDQSLPDKDASHSCPSRYILVVQMHLPSQAPWGQTPTSSPLQRRHPAGCGTCPHSPYCSEAAQTRGSSGACKTPTTLLLRGRRSAAKLSESQ